VVFWVEYVFWGYLITPAIRDIPALSIPTRIPFSTQTHNTMKTFLALAFTIALLSLSACGTNTPKITPKQPARHKAPTVAATSQPLPAKPVPAIKWTEIEFNAFDNSKTVSVKPCYITLVTWEALEKRPCVRKLSAKWNSSPEQRDFLTLTFEIHDLDKFYGITGAKLNIDGTIVDLAPAKGVTETGREIYLVSKMAFTLPLRYLPKILKSQQTTARLETINESFDDYIGGGRGDKGIIQALTALYLDESVYAAVLDAR